MMETIDGRQFANRHDLMEHTGYTRGPLSRMWRDREENGHPTPRMINGVMHWDLRVWSAWFAEHNRQRRGDAARRRAGGRLAK
ncbi:hypothetical protein [Streptomyces sp. 5-10]|uniref:hypothetical protein n=1 Tax=Streptomyces sp. 5-10 TaxID=878925 RepID=UPI001CC28741|nr:hypothetical protein [Streptomyces sp. 5-10]